MLLNRSFARIATAVFLSAPAALYAQTPPWALPSATERYSRANDAQVSYYDARRIAYDQGYREGVKEGDKEVIYTFIDAGAKESYHKTICTEGKAGSVTGVVSKKDDAMFIKPSKDGVKFD